MLTVVRVGEMVEKLEGFLEELHEVGDGEGDKTDKAAEATLHAENLLTVLRDLESVA